VPSSRRDAALGAANAEQLAAETLGRGTNMLKMHANGRFLASGDGGPFFYLADTARAMLQRLDREETNHYLKDRACAFGRTRR
jgi:hypothetical protein